MLHAAHFANRKISLEAPDLHLIMDSGTFVGTSSVMVLLLLFLQVSTRNIPHWPMVGCGL